MPSNQKTGQRSFFKKDDGPGPYDGHLKPFGADLKNSFTMGSKYKPEVNNNPPPGAYDPDRADSVTKYRSPGASIREDRNSFKKDTSRMEIRPNENPSPGQYDKHLDSFGQNAKSFTIAEKREQKIDRSLGPGDIDTDISFNMTKTSLKGGPYIASDNDFEGRNSFAEASANKSRYSNKYLLKNMSPDTRNKVVNMSKSFTVSSKKILISRN